MAMRDGYIRVSQCFLFAYSITSRASLQGLQQWIDQILRVKDLEPHWEPDKHVPAVIVATKSDLESERQVSMGEGLTFAMRLGVPFFETSAKLGINVIEALEQCVRERYRLQHVLSGPTKPVQGCSQM
eukprot:TRINITY_DN5495_c0_g1_i7.p2 TRINITY_DN5495_c0_g1~~TRINITY_DN5495_c0_g1_i7.p2  ORF type:complete len:128 (-),score=9.51 TRINITY_DN5495_c0_g1_i7:115-498(-)